MNHKKLALLCEQAYSGLDNCYSKFIGKSQHKYVIETPENYIIVFRGSVNMQDWLNNLSFDTTNFYNTNVSIGFLTCLEEDKNRQLKYDKPLIVCGHSLGGAVAILHAFELETHNNIIEEVVTFGAPFVGAKSFQDEYNFGAQNLISKTTQYINGNDIVPELPPIKFYHVGKQVYIGKKYKWYNPLKWVRMFLDHRIGNYINSIYKYDIGIK
jgi:predicted lipase